MRDLSGLVFGRLTVKGASGRKDPRGVPYWKCVCVCGACTEVHGANLLTGNSKSCGCLFKELLLKRNKAHGLCSTKAYISWYSMKTRCKNSNCASHKDYGGRNITISPRWEKFENFYADMGDRPLGYSLGRIDNNKGYSPENCRWETRKQQNRNKRSGRTIAFRGESKILIEWAEHLDVSVDTLRSRLNRGWSADRAFTTKPKSAVAAGTRTNYPDKVLRI